jgi:ferredoxin-NADP reductase
MTIEWFDAAVRPNRRLTKNAVEVAVALPAGFAAPDPGSFLVMEKRLPSGELRRSSFSIVAVENGECLLGVKVAGPNGLSSWLNALTAPASVRVSGPFGSFRLDPDRQAHVLVAGGSGITPVWSIARALIDRGQKPTLVFANDSPEQAMYLDDLQRASLGGKLTLIEVYDRDFARHVPIVPDAAYRVCGPSGMMAAVREVLSAVDDAAIAEEFYGQPSAGEPGLAGQLLLKRRWGKAQSVDVPPGQSLLQSALSADIQVPHACGTGACGTCAMRLESGTVQEGGRSIEAGAVIRTCISHPASDQPVVLRPLGGLNRNELIAVAAAVAAVVLLVWAVPPGMGFRAAGPMNTGHNTLSCQDCHKPAAGTVRQQFAHNAKTLLGLHDHDWVPIGYSEVDNAACLACHDRPNDRHPTERFEELRFAEQRATLGPHQCNNCHGEHHGERVAAVQTGFCVNCHSDLALDDDPIDTPHATLVADEQWNTCLTCHDFHGNHIRETPTRMAERLHDDAVEAYFEGGEDPFGLTKRYNVITE